MEAETPKCKQCDQLMTAVSHAKSVEEMIFKGWYCHDCKLWKEPAERFTIGNDGEKHYRNGG